jgi:hypothetical protein
MGQHDRRILCFPSTLDYLDQTTIICRDRAQSTAASSIGAMGKEQNLRIESAASSTAL